MYIDVIWHDTAVVVAIKERRLQKRDTSRCASSFENVFAALAANASVSRAG
jgi:hypothetical protein